MSDYIVLQFLVFAGIVAGAYYHGFKIGVSEGAGNMYDYLKRVRKVKSGQLSDY